jgi:hypothetical protein
LPHRLRISSKQGKKRENRRIGDSVMREFNQLKEKMKEKLGKVG